MYVIDLQHHHNSQKYARCDVSEYRQLEKIWTGGGWPFGYNTKPKKFDYVYHLAAEFEDGMVRITMKLYGNQMQLAQKISFVCKKEKI